MDYSEELKRLEEFKPGENSDFWSPAPGQFRVKALTELEDATPFEEEGKEPKPRKKLKISLDGKELDWTFTVGKTMASTYGQLVHLAAEKGNKLKDVEFTVVVVNDGKKNSYTIVL